MSRNPIAIVKTRGVILHEGKLFLCRLTANRAGFYALPGGTLEYNETLKEWLAREMFEELAVEAKIGPLVYTQEMIGENETKFDFWFWIENATDFLNVDTTKASHGFEHDDVWFYSLDELEVNFKPESLRSLIKIWNEQGPVFVSQEMAENS